LLSHFFVNLQRQAIFHTNLIIPLCIYKLGQLARIVFLLGPAFYTTLIFFRTKLFIPYKLKAHIASSTYQNWGNTVGRFAPLVSYQYLKLFKHLAFTRGFKHATKQCFQKESWWLHHVDTSFKWSLIFLRKGSWYLVNSMLTKSSDSTQWNLENKEKTFVHIFTLKFVHILEIF